MAPPPSQGASLPAVLGRRGDDPHMDPPTAARQAEPSRDALLPALATAPGRVVALDRPQS
ncbi:hypothetical protein [Streptomyces tauricus]|uniref:hypothetical protein n=1 Tax=Streptomyces tauricus TaxID=68274 RepID=UPI002243BEBF|nr:hypothetical protein [Streptomyces tauricus]MCW8098400.1 hypothetical protein [Streptomyces tauricus]